MYAEGTQYVLFVDRLGGAFFHLSDEVFFERDLGIVDPLALLHPADIARRDLRNAVDMLETVDQNFSWLLDAVKHRIVDMRFLELQRRTYQESLAVVRYHLMLTLEALEQRELAAEQRRAIEQLGYDANDELF